MLCILLIVITDKLLCRQTTVVARFFLAVAHYGPTQAHPAQPVPFNESGLLFNMWLGFYYGMCTA
jgi:hypothetical protein